jgi:hypothetical protein
MVQVQAVEMPFAQRQLDSLVELLSRPTEEVADSIPGQPAGSGGVRLHGKLSLTLALVQMLDKRSVGSKSGSGLVSKLLLGANCFVLATFALLFPRDYLVVVSV